MLEMGKRQEANDQMTWFIISVSLFLLVLKGFNVIMYRVLVLIDWASDQFYWCINCGSDEYESEWATKVYQVNNWQQVKSIATYSLIDV